MQEYFELQNAPFIPKEENFEEKPLRTSTENKKGFEAFFKDNINFDQQMVFDEDHFKKFLKEEGNNEENRKTPPTKRNGGVQYRRKR